MMSKFIYKPNVTTVYLPSKVVGADVAGDPVNLWQSYAFSVQANWVATAGSLVAAVALQASNDGVVWSDVGGSSQAITVDGSFLWNMYLVGYPYCRLYLTYTSGTGSISATFFAKGGF